MASVSTATLSTVASSASTGVLVAANGARLGLSIVNDSASATLYLAYAATATTSAYTDKVYPGQTWNMDQPIYIGAISGIWDAAVGNARCCELS